MVNRKHDPETGRVLYVYSEHCVYDNGWDDYSILARGLILHPESRSVVATPFPKFFNVHERGEGIPDLPFEVLEKVDGSLAIIHFFEGRWRAATKGSFDSSQAAWTEARLSEIDTDVLIPGTTYLAEAVYSENRIVVRYATDELVLLAAYDATGVELDYGELQQVAAAVGWRVAVRHAYADFAALIAQAATLPATAEGFVVRFSDGHRLKIKGAEYRRIHSLISRCTPLALWESMLAEDDLESIRRDLPEEFWSDFDGIRDILETKIAALIAEIEVAAAAVAQLTDKELGLRLQEQPEPARRFLFPFRKAGNKIDGRTRQAVLREIRPAGNVLDGYIPSYAMQRVETDS
jgi:RNA ligase